jgi:hypothetical protein
VWLLVTDKRRGTPTARLTIGPIAPGISGPSLHTITVPIVIATTGVARNRVDPATWSAIGRVGRFVDSTHDSSLHVEIECVVANPADRYHADQSVRR